MTNDEASTTITIEARDLDTDERSKTVLDSSVPKEPGRQRAHLIDAVAGVHPGARIRSFADGAATFMDRDHLVVAWYGRLPKRRAENADSSQEALFAR